jgi:[ribosomal protein S5]-alanine N-acetyltransferase
LQFRTPRLVLREFASSDLQTLRAYHSDERYQRYYPSTSDPSAIDSIGLLNRFLGWQAEAPRSKYQLAITLASSGELIGNIGLRKDTADSAVAETGFELAPEQWGQGYATEAAAALLDYGFAEMALRRAHAHCVADNQRSVRVLEKIGMKQEGRLREHVVVNGKWSDVLLYGLLASDWQRFRNP